MEVAFNSLPEWQKRDCINQSSTHTCPNAAVQVATVGSGNVFASIRCCAEPTCQARASELAQASYAGMVAGMSRAQ